MTIAYRVYTNQGTGGPVDYSAPVASTGVPTYTAGPLGLSTDNTFVVRAYDPDTGLEQAGSEALVRVVIGADGSDLSGLPNAPHALVLSPAARGGAKVSWAYAPAEGWGAPTGFDVFLTQGPGPPVYASSPAGTAPYTPGQVGYSCGLPGPYALSTYTAAVRSFNAAGIEGNTVTVTCPLGLPAPFAMEAVQVTIGTSGATSFTTRGGQLKDQRCLASSPITRTTWSSTWSSGRNPTRPPRRSTWGSRRIASSKAGAISEPSGGGYARVPLTNILTNFPTATGGTKSNATVITFPAPTASWGTVVSLFVADSASGGNVLAMADLATSKTINAGGSSATVAVGALFLSHT